MEPLYIVKIGGRVIEDSEAMAPFLEQFAELPGKKILIHGGGRSATTLAEQLGVQVRMVEGRRITDAAMLRVVTMVYGGQVNKTLVSRLQACGCNALGLTGADAGIILAHRREVKEIDYGFVGDIDEVRSEPLISFLSRDLTPVLAPLTHDGQGNMLNTNADTIAATVAIALASHYEVRLVYCFEKPGVLEDVKDDRSVIPELPRDRYRKLQHNGQIARGMIPKLDTGYQALEKGVAFVYITHAADLQALLAGEQPHTGTRLTV